MVGLHNLHGYYLNVPILFDYLISERVPIVWTLHDCWPLTGHCANFDRFACDKWKAGCSKCPMTSYYPRSLVDNSRRNWNQKRELFGAAGSLTLVVPSRWLARIVSQSYLGKFPTRVIPNGIDIDAFKPTPESGARPIVLGVANHWNQAKGLDDFFQLRQFLASGFGVMLVGLEPRQLRRLPKGIEGVPRTQNVAELAALYSSASVFVNPTYGDNFPTTNLEALACGTPVITYATGGSPESVTGDVGRVVAQGDIAGLAMAVTEIAALDRENLRQMCRSHAVRKYDRTERFAEYVSLFEEAFARGLGSSSTTLSEGAFIQ